jgi:hypothetical protein
MQVRELTWMFFRSAERAVDVAKRRIQADSGHQEAGQAE